MHDRTRTTHGSSTTATSASGRAATANALKQPVLLPAQRAVIDRYLQRTPWWTLLREIWRLRWQARAAAQKKTSARGAPGGMGPRRAADANDGVPFVHRARGRDRLYAAIRSGALP